MVRFLLLCCGCAEPTLLKNGTLAHRRLRGLKSIVKVLCVKYHLSVLGKLLPQQGALLVLMNFAHVNSRIYIRSRPSIESAIILVEIILRLGLSAVESSKVCLEIWVLTHTCVYTMAPSDSPTIVSTKTICFVLDSTHFFHC